MLAGTMVSAFGYLSAVALATPRTLFAIGCGGVLPVGLGRVHPRFRTPHVAIATQAVITLGIAMSGTFDVLVPLASVAVLTLYLTVCLAAWQLARRNVGADGTPFTVPTVVPFIGAALCLWLLWNAKPIELEMEAGVLAAASALFLLRRWPRGPVVVAPSASPPG